jgi:hypothetical protein
MDGQEIHIRMEPIPPKTQNFYQSTRSIQVPLRRRAYVSPSEDPFSNRIPKEQNKQEDPTLYPEKGQTHSPSFPYLRKSVAVGANRCDLAISEPAPISPKVK